MSIRLHSKAFATAIAVAALGTVGVTAIGSGASGAAPVTAALTNGNGYWLAGSDGGVFAFGAAHFYGSMAGKHLNAPISGIVATADDHGYWLVGRDGATYAFGDATPQGSMAGNTLAGPVIGIAAPHPGTGGAQGPVGPRGAPGAPGTPGTPGTPGAAGQPNSAYIFNVAAETVAIDASITFDTNASLVGFTHTAGTAAITVTNAGRYRVDTSVSAVEPNQVALFVNGVAVSGGLYGSGAGTQQNNGQSVVTLAAGDVLTLRNHSSPAAFTLQTLAGGTQTNVNASVLIQQLA